MSHVSKSSCKALLLLAHCSVAMCLLGTTTYNFVSSILLDAQNKSYTSTVYVIITPGILFPFKDLRTDYRGSTRKINIISCNLNAISSIHQRKGLRQSAKHMMYLFRHFYSSCIQRGSILAYSNKVVNSNQTKEALTLGFNFTLGCMIRHQSA